MAKDLDSGSWEIGGLGDEEHFGFVSSNPGVVRLGMRLQNIIVLGGLCSWPIELKESRKFS